MKRPLGIPVQNVLVMDHLRTAPITPREALDRYGCFRLGARIYDLRQKGNEILTTMVLNEYGNPFAEYHLIKQSHPTRGNKSED